MEISKTSEISVATKPDYDRVSELKAFDETKEGVKRLVDASITSIPRMFHHEIDKDSASSSSSSSTTKLVVPSLITNDRFKSVEHRVLANRVGPRVSIASFFSTSFQPSTKLYGPIKELVSEENPPKYKEITVHDYVVFFMARGLDGTSALPYFTISFLFWQHVIEYYSMCMLVLLVLHRCRAFKRSLTV
ncbi:1-aminocyclopropane-1-carboxylate oxidase homolog 12-like [Vicia villosa]|uniref:1-aminocyclopropane-1-carboxylate oxidase homolog 12-like n=1 Tax=Vicia villosa TaxID=3911 RepID=UPI00273BE0F1|nr:1-aminocyclopropane-1-carboxylate oxidase homolog 12-like [Vicia villosa]